MTAENFYSSEIREWLRAWWINADKRHEDAIVSGDIVSAVRWKELQDREREERLYFITERAVFRATLKAHVVLVIMGIGAVLLVQQVLLSVARR